ncbi:DUF6215 domain-containing protein [Streptomyces sp. NPDC050504]|uniref:DUF6215 domain-containing protein n=1 Tax=Streptomyces sp. NPDC050504 TaxID=3365618 RepID=UPI0037961262
MDDDNGVPKKSAGAWGQALAALAVVAALGVGLWTFTEGSSETTRKAAACPNGESGGPSGKGNGKPPRLSGAQLCAALNRPDLPALLGTTGEVAKSVGVSGDSGGSTDGGKAVEPSAQIELDTYTVALAASQDRLPVADFATLMGKDARQGKVLNRAAVLYADRTIVLRFGGGKSGPGAPARSLTVARDAKDSGGSYTVTLWREDGTVPSDQLLLRVARSVLPTVPHWADKP